ncbi:TPA: RsmD family RNA methyltransferase [Candidatus Galligastranaerophilus intestinavium]|uniref:Methyltransferase n=1 Tax=Candidatus Galligastranaerophilus intestinavium TaxID=2840836 RepID=A0A9D1JXV0_9BACT|nr:RsmD family RNA methyltransferase [Candidatus Galligastranaerophilus intestinavium]
MAGNLKNKLEVKQGGLSVVKAPKTKPYNDIDLNNWKLYSHIKTGSLWEFSSRDKSNGHSYDYHGNYIPQIATQLFERFTKKNDVILDLFFGSGTSGIEALNMERRCIGVELKEDMVDYVSKKFTKRELVSKMNIICADSASLYAKEKIEARLEIMGKKAAQFLVLHPPYDDIIKFSDKKEDLSNCATTEEFYELFKKVAKNGYDLLEKKRFAALIIGDKYANSRLVNLSFECQKRMEELGFITKAVIVKNITGNEKAKGKQANLWRYRALAGGFYTFDHEYIIIFQKL